MTLHDTARRALGLMDLTSLNDGDTDASVQALAASAATPFGTPAALCVYPRFIGTVRAALDAHGLRSVRIAAVANFPAGAADVDGAAREVSEAFALGADEVDVVFPWRALLASDVRRCERLVAACSVAAEGHGLLKVILETGELTRPVLIREAADIAIGAGADFIKTSTGKVPVNATLDAARIMLQAIRDAGGRVGFKAAGGVRSAAEAGAYLALADDMMGANWADAMHFRFGASGLLAALVATLSNADGTAPPTTGY